jgi:hypothetical protein
MDFLAGYSFRRALPLNLSTGSRLPSDSDHGNRRQRIVGLPVAASVKSISNFLIPL